MFYRHNCQHLNKKSQRYHNRSSVDVLFLGQELLLLTSAELDLEQNLLDPHPRCGVLPRRHPLERRQTAQQELLVGIGMFGAELRKLLRHRLPFALPHGPGEEPALRIHVFDCG